MVSVPRSGKSKGYYGAKGCGCLPAIQYQRMSSYALCIKEQFICMWHIVPWSMENKHCISNHADAAVGQRKCILGHSVKITMC